MSSDGTLIRWSSIYNYDLILKDKEIETGPQSTKNTSEIRIQKFNVQRLDYIPLLSKNSWLYVAWSLNQRTETTRVFTAWGRGPVDATGQSRRTVKFYNWFYFSYSSGLRTKAGNTAA